MHSLTLFQLALFIYICYRIAILPFDLWVYYVAIMRLKMVRDAGMLTEETKLLGTVALLQGYIMDLLVNVILGSILFKEFPKELTLSRRLHRWATQDVDLKRKEQALSYQAKFLNNIDPAGIHKG